ncbi:hypothetical protein ACE1TI_20070 [Alteribacillus sp. JSM 102045]|uniref:hypothetical protein n=1 Tax=Alteribacillus sp. JSM 102045 TaxID=1562101 RepID=UPI0035C06909
MIDMVNGFAKQVALYHQNIEILIEPIRKTMKDAKANAIPIIGFGDAHEKHSLEFNIFSRTLCGRNGRIQICP